jgi:hypothetical protein
MEVKLLLFYEGAKFGLSMKIEHTLKLLKDAYEIRSGNGTEKITYCEESQAVLFIENV